jgi:hypothetical protein
MQKSGTPYARDIFISTRTKRNDHLTFNTVRDCLLPNHGNTITYQDGTNAPAPYCDTHRDTMLAQAMASLCITEFFDNKPIFYMCSICGRMIERSNEILGQQVCHRRKCNQVISAMGKSALSTILKEV